MRAVLKCTKTGRNFFIGIPTTAPQVARYWRKTIAAKCPHCGEQHLEGFQQLYSQALMGGANWGEILDAPWSLRKQSTDVKVSPLPKKAPAEAGAERPRPGRLLKGAGVTRSPAKRRPR